MNGPLSDIRVADFTWVLAGPHATKVLADWGAQVIKVENREGSDLARRLPPFPPGMEENANGSGYYNNLNRNKLSLTLDLRDPRGHEVARRLVAASDLVMENFSAGVMQRLGLDYESLRRVRPDVVMVSMAGLGQTGPWKDYVSYGPIIQASSGLTYVTGYPDRPPTGIGYSYSDFVGGINAAYAALTALHYRRRTGRGQYVDLSQLEASVTFLGPGLLDWTANARCPQRTGNRNPYTPAVPHGVYRCAGEDRWCAIAVFTEEEWQALCRAMERPDLLGDPCFATVLDRASNAGDLGAVVEEWTGKRPAEEVMETLQRAGVAAGVVQNAQDMQERDPHLRERGFYRELDHPDLGLRRFEGSPIRLSDYQGGPRRAGPTLGQDNEFVLREILGYSEEQVNELIVEEVV